MVATSPDRKGSIKFHLENCLAPAPRGLRVKSPWSGASAFLIITFAATACGVIYLNVP